MSRGTRATIDLDALQSNLNSVRDLCGDSRLVAVVKANAYGHGIEPVVATLRDSVDAFAVATLQEAERVRRSGARVPVLLLEGVSSAQELEAVGRHGLDLMVHSHFQVDQLAAAPDMPAVRVWLKVDTGMHRLGFPADEAAAVAARLSDLPNVKEDLVLTSHLANADDVTDDRTRLQLERFRQLQAELGLPSSSLANSAGLAAWPETRFNWVRSGLMLYGGTPLLHRSAEQLGLSPCLTLRSTLLAINHCRAGDAVGYGGTYRCPEDMPVGVVAIGYGDGYPRHAVNGTPVLVGGQRCPLAGRVSMDMLTVDLRAVSGARVGDPVVLWGEGLPVDEIARACGTIPYELMCGVTERVPSEYLGSSSLQAERREVG